MIGCFLIATATLWGVVGVVPVPCRGGRQARISRIAFYCEHGERAAFPSKQTVGELGGKPASRWQNFQGSKYTAIAPTQQSVARGNATVVLDEIAPNQQRQESEAI